LKSKPQDIKHLDVIWNLALGCQVPEVVPKAIDFLIKTYTSFQDDVEFNTLEQLQLLIDDCMKKLE
jgi:hypothetical protein